MAASPARTEYLQPSALTQCTSFPHRASLALCDYFHWARATSGAPLLQTIVIHYILLRVTHQVHMIVPRM